jgi:hypothetical protein
MADVEESRGVKGGEGDMEGMATVLHGVDGSLESRVSWATLRVHSQTAVLSLTP